MPRVSNELTTQYWEPDALGPVAQCDYSWLNPATTPAAGIAAGATFDTGIIDADGFRALAAAILMSQAGSITVSRYLDRDGLLPQGAAQTQAITAGTPAVLNVVDNLPFMYFRVQFKNTGAALAVISAFAITLNGG